MNLHLTRDEADRLTADGRVVLFRAGVLMPDRPSAQAVMQHVPPVEFVEAAQPCEACEGRGFNMIQLSPTSQEVSWCTNPDCLDGKRRVAVVVPCPAASHEPHWAHPTDCNDGLVTVGHVVVEWGPAIVVLDQEEVCSAYEGPACVEINPTTGYARYWPAWHSALEYEDGIALTLLPDVDSPSLVGQYALGIRKVET